MNIYNEDDDNFTDILTGKVWLEKPQKPPLESENSVKVNLEEMPILLEPTPFNPPPDYLSKINQLEEQLSQIQSENNSLKSELSREKEQNNDLQQYLNHLSEQNTNLDQEKSQLAIEKAQIQQELISEQTKRIVAENNLAQANQINQHLRQQLQTERETNANLTQKLSSYEQNHTNLQTSYQKALNDKQTAEKQLNQLTREIKNAVRLLTQWQKFNYYQQLEKERSEQQAQIIQPNFKPPP
jgi:chromosome segregation ATPase